MQPPSPLPPACSRSRAHPPTQRLPRPRTPPRFPLRRPRPLRLSRMDESPRNQRPGRHPPRPLRRTHVISIINFLFSVSRHFPDSIQIPDINRNRNIRRIPVIQKMFQPNLHRYPRNHFAKPRHLQKFNLPDLHHLQSKLFPIEPHLPPPNLTPLTIISS